MRKQNSWVCLKEPFSQWVIKLPRQNEDREAYMEILFQYMQAFLQIGKRYQIVEIERSALHKLGAPQIDYIEQAKWFIENKQELPFLAGIYNLRVFNRGSVINKGVVSYYENDGVVIVETDNLVNLLRQRQNYEEFEGYIYRLKSQLFPVSPIEIYGSMFSISKPLPYPTESMTFDIRLHTDIWFPKVLDLMNCDIYWEDAKFVDNSELAYSHTPRLNQFLQEVRSLTLEYGGEWAVFPPYQGALAKYSSMITETGIRLDS